MGDTNRAVQGLATVAMLKAQHDAGRDHLGMFEPLALDTLASADVDGITAEEVRDRIERRHQLTIPIHIVATLLKRIGRNGYVERTGGRYFGLDKLREVEDIEVLRKTLQAKNSSLAGALRDRLAASSIDCSVDEALEAILKFVERNHVSMILAEPLTNDEFPLDDTDEIKNRGSAKVAEEREEEEAKGRRIATVTAHFILEVSRTPGPMLEILQDIVSGFVLQSTLLLKDISTASRNFQNLRVFIDSGVLFDALGYNGLPAQRSTTELLDLLRDTGCSTEVFDETLREMRRILAVYEIKLKTHSGRMSLYQTEMTRHFLTNRYSSSDIHQESALLETNVKSLGVKIQPRPARVESTTLGEMDLGKLLSSRPGGEFEPRVQHDVDCIAAVLTFRRGRRADSWDRAGAVFMTQSPMTVSNTCLWYGDEEDRGKPPIIHQYRLSDLAWIKKPARSATLKLEELVALCEAALKPTRQAWEAFVIELRKLEESGVYTSDEVTSIVANRILDQVLSESTTGDHVDAETVGEAIRRVRAADAAAAEQQRRALMEAHSADQSAVLAERDSVAADLAALQASNNRRSRQIGVLVSWCISGALGVSLALGTAVSIIGAIRGSSPSAWAAILALVPLLVCGLFSLLWGFNIRGWQTRLSSRVENAVHQWVSRT